MEHIENLDNAGWYDGISDLASRSLSTIHNIYSYLIDSAEDEEYGTEQEEGLESEYNIEQEYDIDQETTPKTIYSVEILDEYVNTCNNYSYAYDYLKEHGSCSISYNFKFTPDNITNNHYQFDLLLEKKTFNDSFVVGEDNIRDYRTFYRDDGIPFLEQVAFYAFNNNEHTSQPKVEINNNPTEVSCENTNYAIDLSLSNYEGDMPIELSKYFAERTNSICPIISDPDGGGNDALLPMWTFYVIGGSILACGVLYIGFCALSCLSSGLNGNAGHSSHTPGTFNYDKPIYGRSEHGNGMTIIGYERYK